MLSVIHDAVAMSFFASDRDIVAIAHFSWRPPFFRKAPSKPLPFWKDKMAILQNDGCPECWGQTGLPEPFCSASY